MRDLSDPMRYQGNAFDGTAEKEQEMTEWAEAVMKIKTGMKKTLNSNHFSSEMFKKKLSVTGMKSETILRELRESVNGFNLK